MMVRQWNVFGNGRLFSTDVLCLYFMIKIALNFVKFAIMKIILLLLIWLMITAQMCEISSVNFQAKTHNKLFSSVALQKHRTNTKTRKKRYCAPISLYSNHCITFQLIISGDIETNPGPNLLYHL